MGPFSSSALSFLGARLAKPPTPDVVERALKAPS
jgi:hypothetical protein